MAPLWIFGLSIATLSRVPSAISKRIPLFRFEDRPLIEHRPDSYHRRMTTGPDGSFALVPLNLGTGTHYTWVYAGTPPQRASVIVDTGSHIMAFPCAECSNCGIHTDPPFNLSMSSTVEYVSCKSHPGDFDCQRCQSDDRCVVKMSYTEGSSWTATLIEDIVWLGNDTNLPSADLVHEFGVRMKFGCQTFETGLFNTQVADGIIGMADYEIALVDHLYAAKKIQHHVFSLCFSKHGGSMVLGAPETFKHTGPVATATLIAKNKASHWYGITITDILIGTKTIGVSPSVLSSGKGIIVDSGTTDSFLPSSIKRKFRDVFESVSTLRYKTAYSGECKGYTYAEIQTLPNITFVLNGPELTNVEWIFTTNNYLSKSKNGLYCGSLYLSEGSGGVIGANFMQDHDFIFDTDDRTVSMAPAQCDYTQEVVVDPNAVALSTDTPLPTTSSPTTSVIPMPTTSAPIPTTSAPVPTTSAPIPTTSAPIPTTSAPVPTTSAPVPTTSAPVPTTSAPISTTSNAPIPTTIDTHTSLTNQSTHSDIIGVDSQYPAVLSIVGALLVCLFVSFSIGSCFRQRSKRQWSRLQDEADNDNEFGLDEELSLVHDEESQDLESIRPATYRDKDGGGIEFEDDPPMEMEQDAFFDEAESSTAHEEDDDTMHNAMELDRL